MNLCRFALHDSPEVARSGIFHENRVYETDGEKAIGIHDLSKLALLPPIVTSPSVRLFGKTAHDSAGYHYVNPSAMQGPLGQLGLPAGFAGLNIRWAAVVGEAAEALDAGEAAPHILAYTLLVNVFTEPFGDDFPFACGPFLFTPDVLDFSKPIAAEVKVGDQVLNLQMPLPTLHEELSVASQTRFILPGDLIAGRPLPFEWGATPAAGQQLSARLGDLTPLVVHLT
ncbi:MAG: hypothetical protein JNJ45_12740 [Chthonomonas sp.]|nr:hypothetical protein [Chthonomonas sp.]